MDDAQKMLFLRDVEMLPRKGEKVVASWEGRVRQFTVLEVTHRYDNVGNEYVIRLGLDF